MSERFTIASVSGFKITPVWGVGGQTRREPPTSYYVLDRAYCHREAAAFDAHDPRYAQADRLALAEARAAELNAWDAAL